MGKIERRYQISMLHPRQPVLDTTEDVFCPLPQNKGPVSHGFYYSLHRCQSFQETVTLVNPSSATHFLNAVCCSTVKGDPGGLG